MGLLAPHKPYLPHQIPLLGQQSGNPFNPLAGNSRIRGHDAEQFQYDNMERKEMMSIMNSAALPNIKNAVLPPLNQGTLLPPPQQIQSSSYHHQPMPNYGFNHQGHQGHGFSGSFTNHMPIMRQHPFPMANLPNRPIQQMHSLPLVPTPALHPPIPQSSGVGGAYSGLIGRLMDQGLISLGNENPAQVLYLHPSLVFSFIIMLEMPDQNCNLYVNILIF